MYGENMPPNWNNEYKPGNSDKTTGTKPVTQGYPDLILKEVARKDIPKLIKIENQEGLMAADLNSVRATIEARLATELANSPAIPVVFHNMAYEPTPNSSWVQCQTAFGGNEYLSLRQTSNSQNRIFGLLIVQHFFSKRRGAWC